MTRDEEIRRDLARQRSDQTFEELTKAFQQVAASADKLGQAITGLGEILKKRSLDGPNNSTNRPLSRPLNA